jgi:hypothetical protein
MEAVHCYETLQPQVVIVLFVTPSMVASFSDVSEERVVSVAFHLSLVQMERLLCAISAYLIGHRPYKLATFICIQKRLSSLSV